MPRTAQLDREILEAALIGLEQQRDRIVADIAQIRDRLGSPRAQRTAAPKPKATRKKPSSGTYWTPERRAAQAEAMRQRMAAAKMREHTGNVPETAAAASAGE